MGGLIQNEDVKTLAELTGAGGVASQLINDTKIYVTANSLNKQLSQAITDGDIGGGGGAGSPDTVFSYDAESYSSLPTLDEGNNATPTPGAGGVFSGTTSLLSDRFQILAGASANDFSWSPLIPIASLLNSHDGSLSVFTDYDGANGDWDGMFYDDTNSSFIGNRFPIKAGAQINSLVTSIADGVTNIRVGFFKTNTTSGTFLKFNRFNFQTRPFVFDGIKEDQSTHFAALGSTMTATTAGDLRWGTFASEQGDGVYSYDDTNGRFTFNRKAKIGIGAALRYNGSSNTLKINLSGTTKKQVTIDISKHNGIAWTEIVNAGDYITINHTAVALTGVELQFMSLVAEAQIESIVTPTKENLRYNGLIANAGSSSITNQGPDNFIASVNRASLGTTDITWKTGFFPEAPAVDARISNQPGAHRSCYVSNVTTTGCRIETYHESGAIFVDLDFFIFVDRAGDDSRSNNTAMVARPIRRIARVYGKRASVIDDGTATSGSWETRVLSDTEGDTSFLKLLSNQIEFLASGTYRLKAKAPAQYVDRHQSKIYDVTNAVDIKLGTSEFSGNGSADVTGTYSFIETPLIDIAAGTKFEIRTRVGVTQASFGHGTGVNWGDSIFTDIDIEKVK